MGIGGSGDYSVNNSSECQRGIVVNLKVNIVVVELT
jgi:hypothetical protein